MKKILWLLSGIVSAFLSGMFLYEGGKLFFWFQDRRGGALVLAAGCAVFVLFVWSMIRFFGEDSEAAASSETDGSGEAVEEAGGRHLLLSVANEIVFGFAAGGIVLYLTRLQTTLLAAALGAGVVLLSVMIAGIKLAVLALGKSKE